MQCLKIAQLQILKSEVDREQKVKTTTFTGLAFLTQVKQLTLNGMDN